MESFLILIDTHNVECSNWIIFTNEFICLTISIHLPQYTNMRTPAICVGGNVGQTTGNMNTTNMIVSF